MKFTHILLTLNSWKCLICADKIQKKRCGYMHKAEEVKLRIKTEETLRLVRDYIACDVWINTEVATCLTQRKGWK